MQIKVEGEAVTFAATDGFRLAVRTANLSHKVEEPVSAIIDAVKLQESAGLQVITDGEFRRRSWFQDFLLALSGTGIHWVDAGQTVSAALPFQNDTTVEKLPGHIVRVTGKIRRTKGIFTDAFAYLKKQTSRGRSKSARWLGSIARGLL